MDVQDGMVGMTDEPGELDQTAAEWAEGVTSSEPVELEWIDSALCHFDPDTNAAERAVFVSGVDAAAATQMFASVLEGYGYRVCLLADDLFGPWADEVAEQEACALIVQASDGISGMTIIGLHRNRADVAAKVHEVDPYWCNAGRARPAWHLVDSATGGCRYFYWSTKAREIVGYDVEVEWPLGSKPGDDHDDRRVAIPLSADSPEPVREALDPLLRNPRD